MRGQSRTNDRSAKPHELDAKSDREVGRIVLGERVFIVALASGLSHQSVRADIISLEIAGRNLVIFETKEQPCPNACRIVDDIAGRLTGRELEIAVLVAHGHATKNIAYRLQISEWTVATYLRRIYAKLDVESRAAMVYRCAPLINRVADVRLPAHSELSGSPCEK
jgi:DNA-binding CsgD family transcriptional regulator